VELLPLVLITVVCILLIVLGGRKFPVTLAIVIMALLIISFVLASGGKP
jgi:hypothetical protein